MNQQRARRARNADERKQQRLDRERIEGELAAQGKRLPEAEEDWDSNVITPGTGECCCAGLDCDGCILLSPVPLGCLCRVPVLAGRSPARLCAGEGGLGPRLVHLPRRRLGRQRGGRGEQAYG